MSRPSSTPSTKSSTYHGVVLAAHDVGIAFAAADANDADRRATKAQEDIDALHDEAEKAQDRGAFGRAGLWRKTGVRIGVCAAENGVAYARSGGAALDGAGVARTTVGWGRCWRSDRDRLGLGLGRGRGRVPPLPVGGGGSKEYEGGKRERDRKFGEHGCESCAGS